jgi:hypothetical protein
MVVFANRLYIDTYLFVINIEYLSVTETRGGCGMLERCMLLHVQERGGVGHGGGVVVQRKEANVMAKQLATTFGAPEVTP